MKQTVKIKGDNHVGFCFFSGTFSVCVFVCLFVLGCEGTEAYFCSRVALIIRFYSHKQ